MLGWVIFAAPTLKGFKSVLTGLTLTLFLRGNDFLCFILEVQKIRPCG